MGGEGTLGVKDEGISAFNRDQCECMRLWIVSHWEALWPHSTASSLGGVEGVAQENAV